MSLYRYNLGLRFEDIVEKYPENTAIIIDSKSNYQYKSLNIKVNQFARYLLDLGIGQKDVVGISGTKNINAYICILACLKIGAIYTILDPDSPAERLRRIIKKCSPQLLFIELEFEKKIQDIIKENIILVVSNETENVEQNIKKYKTKNLTETRVVTGANPAYIMYTSGSTGFPKGAVMTHDNVQNFIDWCIETFSFTPEDRLTNVNPLYFDNSVFDIYSSLFSGACLVSFPKEIVKNPGKLITRIDENKCTSWFSVPSLLIYLQTMKAVEENNLKYVKRFIFGGEGYPLAKLKDLWDIYSSRIKFFNVYGPTECTCMCSSYTIRSEDFQNLQGFPPLGKMADNFSYLILDENLVKASDNNSGELYLMGPNVGLGYYNDPERTVERFIQNPYNKLYREAMYNTGDLVRYNAGDGKIYIMGRKDHQIKHMGYRIELEEIENALSSVKGVSQAAVIHGMVKGLSQIIAVVCKSANINSNHIRKELKQIIPDYMIPNRVHFVDALPKNPNGKIDRRKLERQYLEIK